MGDFKVLEKEGDIELDDIHEARSSGTLSIGRLWKAVGRGDTGAAAIVLFDAGFDLGGAKVEDVANVIVIATPDDIRDESYRIWVKLKKRRAQRKLE